MPQVSERFHDGDRELHAVMACGLVPLLMLPLSWWLTMRRVLGGSGSQQVAKRLLVITVFDTVLAIALGGVLLTRGLPEPPPSSDPPRIGIQVDAASEAPGARVASVWQESPAERAGLQKGDIIEYIDGTPIDGWERLNAELRLRSSGDVRRLRLRRGKRELTVDVTPLSGLASDPTPRRLFAPDQGTECGRAWVENLPNTLWPLVAGCFVIGGIAIWGRQRRGPRGPDPASARWAWVLVPIAVAPAIGIGTAFASCTTTGGWSIGTALLGLIAQGLAMLGLGWVVLRALRSELDARMGPQLSTGRAARLAVLYIASAMARAAIALYVLMTLVPSLQQARDPAVNALFEGTTSPLGRVLMVSAAVVLAPLAEEIVFRGILLPGLARHMKTQTALIISAALFGLFHVPSHGIGAIMPGLLGLVFGWARLRTGSLAAPVLLHMANNLLVTLLAWGV
jgi:membrane protease YdiL (CAAX protease family)